MDDIVKAALKKWPNVPHCYGWLALDARGNWFLRDDPTQAAGPFPQIKGSRIEHDNLIDFIQRNYDHDGAGCWYFQNGPQRVYVELEAAPWVWRLALSGASNTVISHTGRTATPQPTSQSVWLDELDRLFVATDIGLGIVHTQDMHLAALAVERGDWAPRTTTFAALVQRHGVTLSPTRRQAA